ncbi:relaxase domain-containing protein [Streptomyces sp. C10-9-1]|uniref:relaxase domain-containing protein n=1 Tax=Streptomyces sp. C10-9-1 TaxID=1859285 RepID=UPI003D764780
MSRPGRPQEQAGVPVGRWRGRGLAALGLVPGEEVTEAQLRNLFGERGRHPYADRIEAERLAEAGVQGWRTRAPGDGHGGRLRVPAAADDLPPVGVRG